MNWFYADGTQQKGPVSEVELTSLVQQGAIKPETLLWREGQPDWQPLGRVRPDLAATTGAPVIGGQAVPEQGKDLLVQQMREGVLVSGPLPTGVQYVGFWWRVLARIIDTLVVGAVTCMFTVPLAFVLSAAGAASGPRSIGSEIGGDMIAQGISQLISWTLSGIYFTWMTGKYGATLGKQALGFKVVTEDGMQPTYWRSFGRWAADNLLGGAIMFAIMIIPVGLMVALGVGGISNFFERGNEVVFGGWVFGLIAAIFVGALVGAFPWWMAAFDDEKRALHDRVCATRVVRK
jgi:uncharacterized RDD family membrane protein YckC